MSHDRFQILVVDDLPSQGEWVRTTTENFFRKKGQDWPTVELVHTQEDAMKWLDRTDDDAQFDIIISDLCLTEVKPPKFEGYDVLSHAKVKQPNARRILVSSRLDFGGRSGREDVVVSGDCVYVGTDGIDTAERTRRLERSLQRWYFENCPQPRPRQLFETETA